MKEPYQQRVFSLPCTFIERTTYPLMKLVNFSFIFLLFVLSACSTLPEKQSSLPVTQQQISERTQTLKSLTNWQLQGKIAFIQPDKREKANINWRYQESPLTQKLNLTTYLGVNVLQLESRNGSHIVEVDGPRVSRH